MENYISNEILRTVIETVVYLVSTFIILFIGKIIYNVIHKNINVKSELVEKDNFAFALSHTGYLIGLLISIGGAIVGPSNGLINDLIDISIYGGLGIILLNISLFINDKVILNKFSVRKEIIEDRNVGTGIIEAASSIASGLIIFGAVTGEAVSFSQGLITAGAFWAIGQIILVITALIYNLITPYDIYKEIEKDNIAVGIGFAGAIIAIANLIRFGIQGEFVGWSNILSEVGIDVLIGLILLPIIRFVADKVLLPGAKLTDEIVNQEKPNNGAALLEAFAYIGGSILLTWCI